MNKSFKPPQTDISMSLAAVNEDKMKVKLLQELKKRALSQIKNLEILYDSDDEVEDQGRLAFIHKLES
jgi:hypothetical protein